MAGLRRPLLLAVLLAGAAALFGSTVPAAAATCSATYTAQLAQVRGDLLAGGSIPLAIGQLQALASVDQAAALDPVIADLQDGDLGGAEQLLGATTGALQLRNGSGCSGESAAEHRALAAIYASPAFANLGQPVAPSWVQQLLNALGGFVGRAVNTLGPLGAVFLAALLLALVAGFAAWRVRQVMASGRQPRSVPWELPAGTDAEAEWGRALDAAQRGDFRTAIRHAFRSALISLTRGGRLPVQPAWTTPELVAHARGDQELVARLVPAAAGFDRAWYSAAPVGADGWEEVRGHCEAMRVLAGRHRGPA
jgi:hypothetical protein